jgi:catechol 2,3-dioxygenase-like lactoylglutathione lyase family enzyme
MAIGIKTSGVHHVALRSADLQRSRRFYIDLLGFSPILEADGIFLFLAGNAAVGVRGPGDATPHGDNFNPYRVGLDHVALACDDEAEIERVASELSAAGVWNTGAKTDETLGKRYVAFNDPDGIRWELYMA